MALITALAIVASGIDVLAIATRLCSARTARSGRLADRDERSHGHDEQNCAHIEVDEQLETDCKYRYYI